MFPLFAKLPPELRARIWELTVEPRRVDIAITGYDIAITGYTYRMTSSAAAPAALQACPEARHHLQRFCGYQRLAFFKHDDSLHLLDAPDHYNEGEKLKVRRTRYVWVNLDVDMIDIGEGRVMHFEPIGHLIRRLRLARGTIFRMNLFDAEKYELKGLFPNVDEVNLVCEDGIEEWDYMYPGDLTRFWACPREHLYLLDHNDMPGEPYKREWCEDGMRFVRAVDLEDDDSSSEEE